LVSSILRLHLDRFRRLKPLEGCEDPNTIQMKRGKEPRRIAAISATPAAFPAYRFSMPFRALGLDANILKAIEQAGYTEPTPIQAAAIPLILNGHDLIGIAQTGTGKTAAFVLPILARLTQLAGQNPRRGIRALVVAPTRELACQTEESVRDYGRHLSFRSATVFGGVGEHPQKQALRSGVDIVVATPGRLLDLMGQGCGDFSGLQFLVLDEADRMLDMGFLPDIRRVVKSLPGKRQTLLFSASLSHEIEGVTQEFLRAPKLVQIGRRANPAETVTQLVYEVPKHLKPALLIHLLSDPKLDSVLVFSRMKHGADRIARHLERCGIKTATLHSNRSQNQRLKALKDFRSGAVRVLVATDIAARGIDVDGISHVVNYDFPMHSEDYVHRIGRTGRAHAVGDAVSFVTPEDHAALRSLERFIGRGIVRKRAEGLKETAPLPNVELESPAHRHERGRGHPKPHSADRAPRGGQAASGESSRPPGARATAWWHRRPGRRR
jgi:ATP-dependent RNA helicase RhlE